MDWNVFGQVMLAWIVLSVTVMVVWAAILGHKNRRVISLDPYYTIKEDRKVFAVQIKHNVDLWSIAFKLPNLFVGDWVIINEDKSITFMGETDFGELYTDKKRSK